MLKSAMTSKQPVLSDLCLEGPRLRLRPVRQRDAVAAFPMIHRERRVLDWLCWQGPVDEADLREAYGAWRSGASEGADYHFAIESHGSEGTLLGTASLRFAGHPFIGDLGYWLGVEHHGRGFGSEMVGLLARLAFGPLTATAVTAEVFPGNDASVAILERNGFSLQRDVPEHSREPPSEGAVPDPDRPRRLFLVMATDLPGGVVEAHRMDAPLEG